MCVDEWDWVDEMMRMIVLMLEMPIKEAGGYPFVMSHVASDD